ncbi:hypothetical protein RRG08_047012 [Elysia crispata]|uniref:Uncharacterized protein n=1 Tax=Elysia crispata TaxID=231223 RepID=A0AAE1AW26_9GAST|nr:hypothetical protein RRG08_047012 [Elysia crispata]
MSCYNYGLFRVFRLAERRRRLRDLAQWKTFVRHFPLIILLNVPWIFRIDSSHDSSPTSKGFPNRTYQNYPPTELEIFTIRHTGTRVTSSVVLQYFILPNGGIVPLREYKIAIPSKIEDELEINRAAQAYLLSTRGLELFSKETSKSCCIAFSQDQGHRVTAPAVPVNCHLEVLIARFM